MSNQRKYEETGDPAEPVLSRYRQALLRGRPRHAAMDDFSLRHPPMPLSRRAKIFSPFDALKGFQEALEAARLRAEGSDPDPANADLPNPEATETED